MNYLSLFLRVILTLIFAALLTAITQVGGIIFLLSILLYPTINRRLKNGLLRLSIKITAFIALYLLAIFFLVPWIARPLGRVPLPRIETNHVRPLTVWTALLNRNYVRPALREAMYSVTGKMNAAYPGTTLQYLDAGFPFLDKFPLLPHLSHHDGKKLDIALIYKNKATGEYTRECLSPIGYGGSEEPKKGEPDRPSLCASQGYWQYGAMTKILPLNPSLLLDEKRTKAMTEFFIKDDYIAKILIEPHLKARFKLTSKKIRLHGCNAVRHDDHIHVQVY